MACKFRLRAVVWHYRFCRLHGFGIIVCFLNIMVVKKTGIHVDVTRQFVKPALCSGLMGIFLIGLYTLTTGWFDPLHISRISNALLSVVLGDPLIP